MGCCGDREKAINVNEEHKWDYITLSDFKSSSCLAPLSYVWLWILVLISGAVYAADAFTAVNLLAFNNWSSQVKPKVSFDVAKWIFAVCIIVSYVFLIYRWIRAWRAIRSGSVAESYLEPLAAIFQSMRPGNGQGYRRFLVFAELTRSRKGVNYIALFVYFQFKGALIIVVAQGPRIAINAMTLYAVMQAQLLPVGDHAGDKDHSAFVQFFLNIETLTQTGNKQETVIYFTMLFALVIWVIAALSLLLSVIFYVFFLWHHIPSSDGSLTKYCRRKIEGRLERIVSKKVKKAIEKQDAKRRKEEQRAMKNGDVAASAHRAPTLPKLGMDDDASSIYTTTSTLPPYSTNGQMTRSDTMSTSTTARTAAMKQPSLPSLSERPAPERSDTSSSYASNAPLLSQAGGMGRSSPVPPMPPLDRSADYYNGPPAVRPMPTGPGGRPFSPMSQGPGGRPFSPMTQGRASPRPQGPPLDTSYGGRMSPAPRLMSPNAGPGSYPNRGPGPQRMNPAFSPYNNRAPDMGPSYEMSPVEATPTDEYLPPQLPAALRPASPAQQSQAQNVGYAMSSPPQQPRAGTAPPANPRAGVPAALQTAIQRREASQPLPRGPNAFLPQQQRSATAPIQPPTWGQGPTPRSNTAAPGSVPFRFDDNY